MERNRIILLDVSGSMEAHFHGASKNNKLYSAVNFLDSIIQNSDHIIIITYNTKAKIIYEGESRNDVKNIIKNILPSGGTNLQSALELLKELRKFELIASIDIITDGDIQEVYTIESLKSVFHEYNCFINFYVIEHYQINEELLKSKIEKLNVFYINGDKDFGAARNKLRDIEEKVNAEKYALSQQKAKTELSNSSKIIKPLISANFPHSVELEKWYSGEIYLYDKEFKPIVEKRIQEHSLKKGIDYESITKKSLNQIYEEAKIKITLNSEEFIISQSHIEFIWFEPLNYFEIRFKVEKNTNIGSIDINIYSEDLIISYFRMTIGIGEESRKSNILEISMLSRVFASYSRKDYEFVNRMKSRYMGLGIYMFIDIQDLHSGEEWEKKLAKEIMVSDLFQLFWSIDAKKSKYVRLEYEQAIKLISNDLKSNGFIKPIYWESPPPKIPEKLSHLNFYYMRNYMEEEIKIETENKLSNLTGTSNKKEINKKQEVKIIKLTKKCLYLSNNESIKRTTQLINFLKSEMVFTEKLMKQIGMYLLTKIYSSNYYTNECKFIYDKRMGHNINGRSICYFSS